MNVTMKINDQTYVVSCETKQTLLNYLRNDLGLTGSKYGCGTNDCGACKVLVDNEAKNSCVLLVKNLDGKDIKTIEYFSKDGVIHPVQQAFLDTGAIQCGYCTPGMVITTISLLLGNKKPTRDEVIEALDGNLCRCTGYQKIIDAVLLAAKEMEVI